MKKAEKIINALKNRNMSGYFVKNKEEAKKKALELIPKNAIIGFGGSITLEQIGILDLLREKKDITLLDRTKVELEEMPALYSKMFSAEVYLSGTNALTENGQIVNVDGRGNRVAAIAFGPRKVIIVVGKNKITPSIDSALERIKKVALPKNLERFKGKDWNSENMWGQVSIIERQRDPNRIHVIIVDEKLGF
jgi:L-lactate utilization protein LutB